jgi:hypothetical protein
MAGDRLAEAAPMLRTLLYGLTLLHLGPGIAFAVLAFGCDSAATLLGTLCTDSGLRPFVSITLASWLVLGAGLALFLLLRRQA